MLDNTDVVPFESVYRWFSVRSSRSEPSCKAAKRLTEKKQMTASTMPTIVRVWRSMRAIRFMTAAPSRRLLQFDDLRVHEEAQQDQRNEKRRGRQPDDPLGDAREVRQERQRPHKVDDVVRCPAAEGIEHEIEPAHQEKETAGGTDDEGDDLVFGDGREA